MDKKELVNQIINHNNGNPLLNTKATGEFLNISQTTLCIWRKKKIKLDFIQTPSESGCGKVFYHASSIADYLLSNTISTKNNH